MVAEKLDSNLHPRFVFRESAQFLISHRNSISHPRSRLWRAGFLAVRAAGPATRPALSFFEARAHLLHVVPSGFRLLDIGNPADPFIAREGREVFPFCQRGGVGSESVSQIHRYAVYRAGGDRFSRHFPRHLPALSNSFYIVRRFGSQPTVAVAAFAGTPPAVRQNGKAARGGLALLLCELSGWLSSREEVCTSPHAWQPCPRSSPK